MSETTKHEPFIVKQKKAVGEILDLARKCREVRDHTQQQYDEIQRKAQEAFEEVVRKSDDRYHRSEEAATVAYDKEVAKEQENYANKKELLKQKEEEAEERIDNEIDDKDHTTRDKLNQEIWMAESLFESGQKEALDAVDYVRKKLKEPIAKVNELADFGALEIKMHAKFKVPPEEEILGLSDEPVQDDSKAEADHDEVNDDEVINLTETDDGTVDLDEAEEEKKVKEPLKKAQREKVRKGANVVIPEGDPREIVNKTLRQAEFRTRQIETAVAVSWFKGWRPTVIMIVVAVAVFAICFLLSTFANINELWSIGGPLIALAALWILGRVVRQMGRRGLLAAYNEIVISKNLIEVLSDDLIEKAQKKANLRIASLNERKEITVTNAQKAYAPRLAQIEKQRARRERVLGEEQVKVRKAVEEKHKKALQTLKRNYEQHLEQLEQTRKKSVQDAQKKVDNAIQEFDQSQGSERGNLRESWKDSIDKHLPFLKEAHQIQTQTPDFKDINPQEWSPPTDLNEVIQFGDLHMNFNKIVDGEVARLTKPKGVDAKEAKKMWDMHLPGMVNMPGRGSLLIRSGEKGRHEAIEVLQATMTRLITSLPAGRIQFTIIDPVGRGESFAGFMHLADYDEKLVGARIWTEPERIDRRLTDMTEHMENVIQKYLRDEFKTIDEYNQQAGELAEPYRFLVVADYPTSFSPEAVKRLQSIFHSGSRCGVYALVHLDGKKATSDDANIESLGDRGETLVYQKDGYRWEDDVFKKLPLTVDKPAPSQLLQDILKIVGKQALKAGRVEVPFSHIVPREEEIWTRSSNRELRVPVGRAGATRLQDFSFGRGVAQHGLMAGKTGSGKSTLLHVVITNLALWYSPDEVQFYLIDFKKGVEFKTYANFDLPHAKAIAVESDREFGFSVLQKLDEEMQDRGELYRELGVQDVDSYRKASGKPMPRIVLLIDEFQEFFSEDDKLAQDVALLLDRLVRQGRAFGMHVLLGSQSLAGAYGLTRGTLGQMAVRIALQCTEADSQLILSDENTAARLLTRPGEAIYNDNGGLIEGNSPFQVSWLPEEEHHKQLNLITKKAEEQGFKREAPLMVFEGSGAAEIHRNTELLTVMESETWIEKPIAPVAWLGEAIAIKPPTAASFRRQSGSNMLIVGQRDEAALAMMCASLVGMGMQHSPAEARFYVCDGTPADSANAGILERVANTLPHTVSMPGIRQIDKDLASIAAEVRKRIEADDSESPAIFLFIYGIQRYRSLAKNEDDFGFSSSDGGPRPDKDLAEILRDGPTVGVHTFTWCDAPNVLNRYIDRGMLREFDHRVLFQMSGNDSSNLIDSPAGSRLGMYRVLYFSDEKGIQEKFRAYGIPDDSWIEKIETGFKQKPFVTPLEPLTEGAGSSASSSSSMDDLPSFGSSNDTDSDGADDWPELTFTKGDDEEG